MTLPSRDDQEVGRFVEPPDLEERLAANWEAIEARQKAPRSHRRAAFVVAGAVAVAAALLLLVRSWSTPPAWAGEVLVTERGPAHVSLPDGSEVHAHPGTVLARSEQSERQVRLRLRRGRALFEVARDPRRAFVVEAGGVEVRVVGTRFSVARGPEGVEVRVERGAVDVRQGDRVERLAPGDVRVFPPAVAPDLEREPPLRERVPTESQEPPEAESTASEREASSAMARARPRPQRPRDPGTLFREAQSARAAGEVRAAIALYARLLQRYPGDGRSALAAMEMGRLQMDEVGDLQGAIRSFRTAIRAAPGSPLRQEAMARIVRAQERRGDADGCREARLAYLERYPEGRHARDLRRRCAD